jgi:hypothetical protein
MTDAGGGSRNENAHTFLTKVGCFALE